MVSTKKKFHLRYYVDDSSTAAMRRIELIRNTILGSNAEDLKIDVESCYNLLVEAESEEDFELLYFKTLNWLISDDMPNRGLRKQSKFLAEKNVIEIGPRYCYKFLKCFFPLT